MKVVCFGSLNIDYTYAVDHFVGRGETLLSRDLQVFSGGKGLNQTIALCRAGVETYHAGAVGEDGLFLVQQLREAGADVRFVAVRDDVRTGHAIIQNSADGDNCILLYGGANQAITHSQVEETLAYFNSGDLLLLQNEISCLSQLLAEGHKRGLRVALNPSPMTEEVLRLPLEQLDYLLLNEVEAEQILGTEIVDGAAAVQALHQKLPHTAIVLTLGKNGAYYADDNDVVYQRTFAVQAVDTTAAGDTFTGYFLAGVMEGLPLQQTMERAARAAAISVTRKGAAPSIPCRAEVEKERKF